MIKESFISVITPMYNAENYILETINSVLSQTYQNWEMIIIDNCSTDNSVKIVENIHDKRIQLIKLDYNSGGPARPRNVGIENSKGDYIAFLDADDVWNLSKLEKQIKFINKNKIKFTSFDCSLIDENSKLFELSKKSLIFNKIVSKKTLCDLIKNNFIITSSVLIDKDLILRFNENKNSIAVEDFDMWLNIFIKYEKDYKYQNEKLLQYRVLEKSASDRSNLLKQELKVNIVLANFLLDNDKYIWCYFNRIFFHLFRKQLKVFWNTLIKVRR